MSEPEKLLVKWTCEPFIIHRDQALPWLSVYLEGPYEFGTTPWMSVSAAKCFSDGRKEKMPDSEIHTMFAERHMLRISTVLLSPHGKFIVNARDWEWQERLGFLASLIDNVFHWLVTATILGVVHAELCHTWPNTLRLFNERKQQISNMARWSFNHLFPCYKKVKITLFQGFKCH